MFIEGSSSGVGFWYVCWGCPTLYDMSIYKTLNGLAKWFAGIGKDVPVHRVGRMVFTEKAPVEKETWFSREEFIKWAKSMVGFTLE